MLSVGCKPADLPAKVPAAQITFCTAYRSVLHGFCLVGKSPGDIFDIRIKLNMDLRLLIPGNMKDIEGIILKYILLDQCQYLRSVVSITEGTVKRNILDRKSVV